MAVDSAFRTAREQRGLTQQAVAIRARCSTSLLVAMERYGYVPGERVRQRLAAAMDAPEAELWPNVTTKAPAPEARRPA